MDFTGADLLFQDRLAPMTIKPCFFQADCHTISQEFHDWMVEIKSKTNILVSSRTISGNLESAIRSLLPLRLPGNTRTLFVSTNSEWTAYFENFAYGSDPAPVRSLARRCGVMSLYTVVAPHTFRHSEGHPHGRQGKLIMELYGPERREWRNLYRAIRLYNDVGKWEFEQRGEAFPFEETERYSARKLRDRFTLDMYKRYMAAFGIDVLNEAFYLPESNHQAVLIELSGDLPEAGRDISFEEARRMNRIEE